MKDLVADGWAGGFGPRDTQVARIRLRTLIWLRWTAIFGQSWAIAVAWRFYDIHLDVGLCMVAIGAAVIANLTAALVYPENMRLSERAGTLMLLFDTVQLAVLLFLTGGLSNPFALLILAPVTIAATALGTQATIIVATATVSLISAVALFSNPLKHLDGTEIAVPDLFGFGFWLAIVIGVIFIGLYARRVASEVQAMDNALLATQMALAREQKLTDLGGVVAATAHELGTPLATIKLVSAELSDELAALPELRADALLIREQAERCGDILRSMGQAGKGDLYMRSAPLVAVIREAAEPHLRRGKTVHVGQQPAGTQPIIRRQPEIVHGLRNLIQNAVDFARANVWIDVDWSDSRILVRIVDDGPGYPAHLIGRMGDPFLRHRTASTNSAERPSYEGMGLGLFIAKTLLERTGAELSFANGADPFLTEEERPERSGAIVEVRWPRHSITLDPTGPLGANRPITS